MHAFSARPTESFCSSASNDIVEPSRRTCATPCHAMPCCSKALALQAEPTGSRWLNPSPAQPRARAAAWLDRSGRTSMKCETSKRRSRQPRTVRSDGAPYLRRVVWRVLQMGGGRGPWADVGARGKRESTSRSLSGSRRSPRTCNGRKQRMKLSTNRIQQAAGRRGLLGMRLYPMAALQRAPRGTA